ncbi:uncharacterized protein LOC134722762 [Mytilus trossulus]|uniref:uncharacterized protein LOC134722762 n=1 Tax=Mytilus trossulus TaxID=6551 RepID=UPI00300706F6
MEREKDRDSMQCFYCKKNGHKKDKCPEKGKQIEPAQVHQRLKWGIMSILLLISLLGLFGAVLGLFPTNISKKDFEKNVFRDYQGPIIKTPNLYKYIPLTDNGIAIGNPVRQSIRFKVKANNDAHVALMSSNNPNDPLYEIVLGGWGNTQSVIRDRKQGASQLAVYRGRVLDSNEFRTFTIKWSNARIRVEDESGKKLMEWTDTTNPYTIRNIGICTGWGSTGIWSFPCQDCQVPIIKTPNLYKYIPLTDNGIAMGNPVRQSISFKVKANNDAHIALMSSNNPNDPLYEIVLGGWGNTHSVIRDRKQGARQLAVYPGQVLNANEFRTFTIKWSNARIRVEDESGKKLMEWTDTTNPYTIRNIGICTGWGSIGIWSFPCQDCQVPIIKTPNLYRYIPLTDNDIAMGNPVRQSIRFKVKANNDAHVALMSSNNPNDPLYEIVLGGWGNTQSVIRDRKQGRQLAVYRGQVLNSNEFRTFTIKWSNARIRVEDESGKKLMEWTDTTNPYTIRNIGICTGWGSTGIWSFPCQDCQVPIIKTPNLYEYIPLTDNGIVMGNPVRQSIRFTVKANNDAHVALMSSNNPSDPLYEIVLGGWGNTQSVIRDRKQGASQLAVHRGRVFNSNEFRTFTIKWSNVRIIVGDESGKKLMEWTDTTNPYTIRNIGICTGWGSTGIWSLHIYRPFLFFCA